MSRCRRDDLLTIFQAGLAAVNGRRCVREYLVAHPIDGAVCVIAIGKAAAAMAAGAGEILRDRIEQGIVITKYGHGDERLAMQFPFVTIEAGHPEPDENTLLAGRSLLDLIDRVALREMNFLFLISGGASSLLEVLPAGITLSDLRALNQWLLGSGLPIGKINKIRKALSCIKGGRLAGHLNGRPCVNLLISDVPGNNPSDIGSGLLVPDKDASENKISALPPSFRALCDLAPTKSDSLVHYENIKTTIIAHPAQATAAAAEAARALAVPVFINEELLLGDAAQTGIDLAAFLKSAKRGVYLWNAETTVCLPAQPGRGGRCQALALSFACEIVDMDCITLLAAGTDGSDGPGDIAGAIVDGDTVMRGEQEGLDARACLINADAGSFLAESGDLLDSGPTGTNVMDLVIAIKS